MFDFLDPSQQFTLDNTLITTLLVISVLITFRSGLFSLATMGFAAVGGYTAAILSVDHGMNPLVGIVLAPILAGAIAALFAPPVLRLRGIYMALGSLALAQAIVVLIRTVDFTNGALGIAGIPLEVETSHLIWVLVVAFVLLQLAHRSHFGRAAKAVRLDERTAEGLGINVFRVRFAGFVTGSAVAGLAGALEAHRTTVISPEQYGFTTLVVVFTYALVGGNGHWLGPVLVTWGVVLIRESLDFAGTEWENIVYGILLVVVMVLAPNGLSDRSLLRGIRRRTGDVRKRVERASHEHGGDEAPTLADAGAAGSSPETEAVKS